MILEEDLLERAVEIHDRVCKRGCARDRKYIRSCPEFANAILRAGKELREEQTKGEGK